MLSVKNIILFITIIFSFSCQDLKQLSEQVKDINNDQSLIMQRQSEIMKQLALLDNKISTHQILAHKTILLDVPISYYFSTVLRNDP